MLSTVHTLQILSALASTGGVVCIVVDVRSLLARQRRYRERVAVARRPDPFAGDFEVALFEAPDPTDPEQLKLILLELKSRLSKLEGSVLQEEQERSTAIRELEGKLGSQIDFRQRSTEELVAEATGINKKPVVAVIGAVLIEAGIVLGLAASQM